MFFSVLIFSKPKRDLADKLLGSWLIILSVQLLSPFLYLADFYAYFRFAGAEVSLYGLHPPLLYLYIRAMTGSFPKRRILLILIAITLLIEISLLSFFTIPAEERMGIILGQQTIKSSYYIFFIPVFLYFIVYFILSIRTLEKYKSDILQIYSYKENVDLLWLRKLLLFFYGLLIACLPLALLFYLNHISIAFGDYFYFAGLTLFIFLLGFWGYKQGKVFNYQHVFNDNKVQDVQSTEQNVKNRIINEKALELKELMDKNQPFLNPTLTIFELAKLSGIQPHQLSRLINREFKCSFFEYINRYRVDLCKEKLSSAGYDEYTLLAIALECGFNSKSSFNRIFKEQTGSTPGEYKKNTLRQKS